MPQVWNVAPSSRVLAVVAGAIAVAFEFTLDGPWAGAVTAVLVGALVWLFAFRPALVLTGTEVLVRNPWGTRRVPLPDVARTAGGYFGLSIHRRSGGSVTAWAVQKSNGASWAGRQTRADEVAAAIRDAAGQASTGPAA
jgi:hypothetical protein